MNKDYLQKELDKKKFFIIRFAFVINLLVVGIIVFLLSVLKIDHQPIFTTFIRYYLR